MNNISLNSAMYNRNQVSFKGTEQAFTKAQKASKTFVREVIKTIPAVTIGLYQPEPIKGAILGGLVKVACDAMGVAANFSRQEKNLPSYMSELNIFKLGGRAINIVTDKFLPFLKNWV